MRPNIPVLPVLLVAWLVGCAALTRDVLIPGGHRISEKLIAQGHAFEAGLALPVMAAYGVALAAYGTVILLRTAHDYLNTGRLTRPQATAQGQED